MIKTKVVYVCDLCGAEEPATKNAGAQSNPPEGWKRKKQDKWFLICPKCFAEYYRLMAGIVE